MFFRSGSSSGGHPKTPEINLTNARRAFTHRAATLEFHPSWVKAASRSSTARPQEINAATC
jgi:hypothetical protein